MNRSSRRGSALLIVLGFLSFMVVSAVAFAIYMRTERLASSGFHRTVATRQLLKAGLSRAIDAIEYGVGDQPFPGLRYNGWPRRVYTPWQTNALSSVPVLTLEALSYLPPALVNDVRAQARGTSTAAWSGLGYDAGRYAFVAVNVSDFFDVNRVRASVARNSSSDGRVSLAYLFKNDDGTAFQGGASASKLSTLDSFLEKRGGSESQVPFVSLADFNVALYNADASGSSLGLVSPFYGFLANGQNADAFYSTGGDETSDIMDMARRELFVTDSYYAPTNKPTEVCDLARDGQPFNFSSAGTGLAAVSDAINQRKNAFWNALATSRPNSDASFNPFVTGPLLYDYLDRDDVPLTLAGPCTERVPMITALTPLLYGGQPAIKLYVHTTVEEGKGTDENGKTCNLTHYFLRFEQNTPWFVNGYTMFPFKLRDDERLDDVDGRFQVKVLVRVFFAKAGGPSTRLTKSSFVWKTTDTKRMVTFGEAVADGKIKIENVFDAFTVDMSDVTRPDWEILQCSTKTDGTVVPNTFKPLVTAIDGTELCKSDGTSADKFVPCVAVWAKVVDTKNSNRVVDMVPATILDDTAENNVNESGPYKTIAFDPETGSPLLYFLPDMTAFAFTADNLSTLFGETGKDYKFKWTAVETPDPRYNHAPENWIADDANAYSAMCNGIGGGAGTSGDGTPPSMAGLLGKDGRDPDYWMFVSNQTNLQSMGELAFLPRITTANDLPFGSDGAKRYAGRDLSENTAAGNLADIDYMWRTYRLYDQSGETSDKLYDQSGETSDKLFSRGVVNVGEHPVRVNPYSDLQLIREAAVADTPYDFWAASRDNADLKGEDFTKRIKYTFNPQGAFGSGQDGLARISRKDLTNIAARIFGDIRTAAYNKEGTVDNWEDTFQNLDWYSSNDPDTICGYELNDTHDDIDSVDRKTLCSLWHDTLGNDQQLFLVFVRVDPTAFGTGGADMIPSQLGGRAVALVWRDPHAPSKATSTDPDNDGYIPHRTRLLFYHQLE